MNKPIDDVKEWARDMEVCPHTTPELSGLFTRHIDIRCNFTKGLLHFVNKNADNPCDVSDMARCPFLTAKR
jgi:hypothetical protein